MFKKPPFCKSQLMLVHKRGVWFRSIITTKAAASTKLLSCNQKIQGQPNISQKRQEQLSPVQKAGWHFVFQPTDQENITPKAHFRFQKALIPKTDSWKP